MLIDYMRVSKADGSQATDLQRDALIAAGVDPTHLYRIARKAPSFRVGMNSADGSAVL